VLVSSQLAAIVDVAGLDLEMVDEVGHIIEAAAGARSDTASGDYDGQLGFAGVADQHDIALLSNEAAAGKVVNRRPVDGRIYELEGLKVFGERQLGDSELVLDRTGLLLVDLGVEQVADKCAGVRAGA